MHEFDAPIVLHQHLVVLYAQRTATAAANSKCNARRFFANAPARQQSNFATSWFRLHACVHMHGTPIAVTPGGEMRASTFAGPVQLKAAVQRELHHAAACAQLKVLGV